MALAKHITEKYRILKLIRTFFVFCFLWYLRFFAKIALIIHRPTIIGIAGAVGKSTAKQAIEAIIAPEAPTRGIEGNSETGIPLGILNLSHGHYSFFDWIKALILSPFRIFSLRNITYLIVEYGIDGPKAPKNMAYLLTIVTPDIAIFLNESPAHVGNYESIFPKNTTPLSLEEKLRKIVEYMTNDDGKLITAKTARTIIINADDPSISTFAQQTLSRGAYYTVGTDLGNDIAVLDPFVAPHGSEMSFAVHTHQIKENVHLVIPRFALPKETGQLLAAAILTGIHLNIPLDRILDRLSHSFLLPPGRGSIFEGKNDSLIIDSSYNASSASVISFLSLIAQLKKDTKRPTVFLFGDMKELGEYATQEHMLVSRMLPGIVDHLLLVGPITRRVVLPSAEKKKAQFKTISWFETAQDAGKYMADYLPKNALVLVKGSQMLEESIKFVLKNPKDKTKLCRQDAFWRASKEKRDAWAE